jgi:hypothetical protein
VRRNRFLVSFIVFYCVFTLFVVWSDQFISSAYPGKWGYLEKTEELYPVIYVIVIGTALSYLDLVLLYLTSPSELDKQRIKYILMGGFPPLFLGSINVFLVSTGGGNNPYMALPLAPLSTIVSAVLIYYGVTKYKILSFKPIVERTDYARRKYAISPSNIYLICEEHRERTTDLLKDMVSQGYSGLVVTRTDPDVLRGKYGVHKTPIIWLSDKKKPSGESVECINPKNLDLLHLALRDFINGGRKTVVCLTHFDSLFDFNSEEDMRAFLEKVSVLARREDTVLLFHVDPSDKNSGRLTELLPEVFDLTEVFAKKSEIGRLREMISVAEKKYRKREINEKVFEEIMRDYEEKLIGLEVDYKKLMIEREFTISEEE